MISSGDGYEGHWMMSMEGVTQGDPLSMILYGLGMLPLTIKLKNAVPECIQPWYVEDVGAGVEFEDIENFLKLLQLWGPIRG